MNAPTFDAGRLALMLNELRLPTIARLWPEFAQRSDKEGWQAARLLGALVEHELAERSKRRIERHRAESHLDPTKTLAAFDFGMVPMVPDPSMTVAAIDRLVHHSTIFEMNVESYRRRTASDKQTGCRRQPCPANHRQLPWPTGSDN